MQPALLTLLRHLNVQQQRPPQQQTNTQGQMCEKKLRGQSRGPRPCAALLLRCRRKNTGGRRAGKPLDKLRQRQRNTPFSLRPPLLYASRLRWKEHKNEGEMRFALSIDGDNLARLPSDDALTLPTVEHARAVESTRRFQKHCRADAGKTKRKFKARKRRMK